MYCLYSEYDEDKRYLPGLFTEEDALMAIERGLADGYIAIEDSLEYTSLVEDLHKTPVWKVVTDGSNTWCEVYRGEAESSSSQVAWCGIGEYRIIVHVAASTKAEALELSKPQLILTEDSMNYLEACDAHELAIQELMGSLKRDGITISYQQARIFLANLMGEDNG